MTVNLTDGRVYRARAERLEAELETLEAQGRAIEEAREALSAMMREHQHEVNRIGDRLAAIGKRIAWRGGNLYEFRRYGADGYTTKDWRLIVTPTPAAEDVILLAPEDGAPLPDDDLFATAGEVPDRA